MSFRRTWLGLIVGSMLSTGCSFTTMQTPRQLEAGEVIVAGAVDWPGSFIIIPRASGQLTYGLGFGDIGAHVGTSLFTLNAGATARGYVTPWLTATLQADMMYLAIEEAFDAFGGTGGAGLLSINPRLTTANVEGDLLYGGIQSNAIFGIGSGTNGLEFGGAFLGVVGGLEYIFDDNFAFQLELTVSPLYITQERIGSPIAEGSVPLFQVGFGVNWGTGRGSTPAATEPTPMPRPPQTHDDPRSAPARPEQAPVEEAPSSPPPVYDDDGVPLY